MAASTTSYNTLRMYFESRDSKTILISLKYCKEPGEAAVAAGKISSLMDAMIASNLFAVELISKVGAEITEYDTTTLI